jgi:hypothetical protein
MDPPVERSSRAILQPKSFADRDWPEGPDTRAKGSIRRSHKIEEPIDRHAAGHFIDSRTLTIP